jgi:ABC-2 type transport system ATP-binding protein
MKTMASKTNQHGGYVLIISLCALMAANGGTYTTHHIRVAVPAAAAGSVNGDTSATTSTAIHLDATVYIPDGAISPTPVILVLHGYGGSKRDSKTVLLAEDFAGAGYVVLTPSLRGFGDSDGKVTLAGPNEVNDLKTMILRMQTGVIGDVTIPVTSASKFGVTGLSYGGGLTWELTRTRVAGLTAVVPIIGWTDLYQALAPNDVPKLTYTLGLFASGFDEWNPNYSRQMGDWLGDMLGGHPENTRVGEPDQTIDWRSVAFTPDDLTVPTFAIQGWRDFLFPAEQATALFAASNSIPFFKMYVGGIGHPPASSNINREESVYVRAQALRWFDQWLKGIETGILNEPRVTLAPERSRDWATNTLVESSAFPLPGTVTKTLFINASLLTEDGPGQTGPRRLFPTTSETEVIDSLFGFIGVNHWQFLSHTLVVNDILNSGAADVQDPAMFTKTDREARKIIFSSDALAADLNVVGLPVLQLHVAAGRPNAYYFVLIEEMFAGGNTRMITRGAFKDHTTDSRVPHLIEFSPFAINHRFLAGSRIRLVIASRDYPFFLPNLDQSWVRIYRDVQHPSALLLPVVPSAAE